MPGTPLLEIRDLHVTVDGTEILRGVDLVVPNRRAARPHGAKRGWQVDPGQGAARLPGVRGHKGPGRLQGGGHHLLADRDRAKAGIFLAFQYPEEIPGVPLVQFLRQALSARRGIDLSVLELRLAVMEWMRKLGMDASFGDRYLNEGFSGGEKKRNEILQMAVLEPDLAVLDETDSGLDIDALKVVAAGVGEVRGARPGARGAGDHALPADPGPPRTRRCAPACQRQHRGKWRPRARPPPRSARGTKHGDRCPRPAAGRGAHQEGLPYPGPPGPREAPRVPGLGIIVAEASGCARGDAALLRDHPCQRPPRRLRHRRGSNEALRGSPFQTGGVHRRPLAG